MSRAVCASCNLLEYGIVSEQAERGKQIDEEDICVLSLNGARNIRYTHIYSTHLLWYSSTASSGQISGKKKYINLSSV